MNYVGSALSLVDHTRKVVRRYEGSPFSREYEVRKERMIARPEVVVVGALRNYMLHNEHPGVGRRTSVTPGETSVRLVIETADLLAWSKLPAGARPYLVEHRQLMLRELLQGHQEAVEELNRWLLEQFQALHGEEVREFNELVREFESMRAAALAASDSIEGANLD